MYVTVYMGYYHLSCLNVHPCAINDSQSGGHEPTVGGASTPSPLLSSHTLSGIFVTSHPSWRPPFIFQTWPNQRDDSRCGVMIWSGGKVAKHILSGPLGYSGLNTQFQPIHHLFPRHLGSLELTSHLPSPRR